MSNPVPSTQYMTVEEVSSLLNLKPVRNKGKIEYHGANPTGKGASDDGFILFAEGNAHDRKLGVEYTSYQVAEMASIPEENYEPIISYREKNHSPAPKSTQAIIEPVQKKYENRNLADRGIRPETLRNFHVELVTLDNIERWQYPTFSVDGGGGCSRAKFLDPVSAGKFYSKNKKPMKYWWVPGDTDPKPATYNLNNVIDARELWIVGGEVDVWTCSQAGIPAVSGYGEGRKIEDMIGEIKAIQPHKIHVCLDNDDAGHKGALKILDVCKQEKIECVIRVIVGFAGADVSDLYERCKFNDSEFFIAMRDLPFATTRIIEQWRGEDMEDVASQIKKKTAGSRDEKMAKAEILIEMLQDKEVFCSSDDEFYITLDDEAVPRTYPMESSKLTEKLFNLFYSKTSKALEKSVVDNALMVLKGKPSHRDDVRQVWIRSGEKEGVMYVDLNNIAGQVVEIDPANPEGWRVLDSSPIFFRRPKGFYSLPVPTRGGNINHLREIINAEDDNNWCMILSWLIYALRPPKAPYPVLSLNGEQGTAKSTTCKILRKLIDPNFTPLIGGSIRDERDLAIMAKNCFVLGFDNLSGLQKWQSDALSQIVTDGGFRTRKLRTDDEEVLFSARRPIILNGIDAMIGREDFLNRSLVCTLPVIPPHKRRDEQEVWDRFDAIWPAVLGWIFDMMAAANRNYDETHLETKPRMADFARWVVAAEESLPWNSGFFMEAYATNQKDTQEASIDASPVATEIQRLLESSPRGWIEATPTEFYKMLNNNAYQESREEISWPKGSNILTRTLNRIAPNLRVIGIDAKTGIRQSGGGRLIRLMKIDLDQLTFSMENGEQKIEQGEQNEMGQE